MIIEMLCKFDEYEYLLDVESLARKVVPLLEEIGFTFFHQEFHQRIDDSKYAKLEFRGMLKDE